MNDKELMLRAIKLSEESVKNGGGPFGTVIARNGEIIAEASNCVTINCDPTAHAEVSAIRKATEALKTFDLSGCAIYTSCEPCPMCLGAIYWAHLDKIYYANDRKDAAAIGFDDDFIYKELDLLQRRETSRRKSFCAMKQARLSACGWKKATRQNIELHKLNRKTDIVSPLLFLFANGCNICFSVLCKINKSES